MYVVEKNVRLFFSFLYFSTLYYPSFEGTTSISVPRKKYARFPYKIKCEIFFSFSLELLFIRHSIVLSFLF